MATNQSKGFQGQGQGPASGPAPSLKGSQNLQSTQDHPHTQPLPEALDILGFGITDTGRVRLNNQDSLLVDNSSLTYIVADGMGGHAGGEIASQMCIRHIALELSELRRQAEQGAEWTQRRFATAAFSSGSEKAADSALLYALDKAVNLASAKIYEHALGDQSLRGMGTTATVLTFMKGKAYCAHVGDSRLYLLRSGFVYQLTSDHSLVNEQLKAGIITEAEVETHHLRNIITRSVGYQEEEEVDGLVIPTEPDDIYMLCSDGLHSKVSADELVPLITTDLQGSAQNLMELALNRGGEDNITIILVSISSQGPASAHQSSQGSVHVAP